MAQKSKTKPAVKAKVKISKAAAKYLQSPGQIGTGVIPVTPPLSSADARKQIPGVLDQPHRINLGDHRLRRDREGLRPRHREAVGSSASVGRRAAEAYHHRRLHAGDEAVKQNAPRSGRC
jgi:hypothetical protein